MILDNLKNNNYGECKIINVITKEEFINKLSSIDSLLETKCYTTSCRYRKEYLLGNKDIILNLLQKCYNQKI